jgi:hypothetical protein
MTREFPSYYGVVDTVTVIWSTAAYVNDSTLIANGYTETDGGWINYFDNPDRPQVRGSIQIHFLQTEHLQGDANDDGVVNIGDALFIINYVFPGAEVGVK